MTETDHAIRGDQLTAALLQHTEELRGALAHAVRLLSRSAGQEAADNPNHAKRLMTTAEHMTNLLNRTGRAGRATPRTRIQTRPLLRQCLRCNPPVPPTGR